MFGRHADHKEHDDSKVAVDFRLEHDIASVQGATVAFLSDPDEPHRHELLTALGTLDELIAMSDAYEERIVSAAYGLTRVAVLGETGGHPVAEDVRASVFRAQAELVKAAKAAVTDPRPSNLEALSAANAKLVSLQPPGEGDEGDDQS